MKSLASALLSAFLRLSAFPKLRTSFVAAGFGCLLAFLACTLAQAQVATYAGIERTVYSADGLNPTGVAVDANGVIYITDYNNRRVLKETPSGMGYLQSTVGPPSGGIQFAPNAVAVDQFLNVYIADGTNGRVLKETWSGSAYTETVVRSGLYGLGALAVDAAQNIFVLFGGNQSVEEEQWSGSGYSPLGLTSVTGIIWAIGIAVDPNTDNLFISDNADGTLRMATNGGGPDNYSMGDYWLAGGDPGGVAIAPNGSLYVAGATADEPLYLEVWNGSGFNETEVPTSEQSGSWGVAVDGNGHTYLADSGNNRVIEEIPGGLADFASVPVGSPSTPISMLFAFSGTPTGFSPLVVTQGAPGQDFADALTGTCTTNGTGFTYDARGTQENGNTNYRDTRNLFCSVNVKLTPAFPGGRFGAVSLQQGGSTVATGYARGSGAGPQVAFTNPGQSRVDSAENSAGGIAADSAGNLYVSDDNMGTVILVAPDGGVTTVTPIDSVLNSPSGVAVDGAGNVYIADTGNSRVLKETLIAGTLPNGTYTESQIPTVQSLNQPSGVAVDGSGNLYIADIGTNLVLKETLAAGTYTETQVTNTSLISPQGVAVDDNGIVYIADSGNGRILKETPSGGDYAETMAVTGLTYPSGVAVDGAGNLFISDAGSSKIFMGSFSGGSYAQTILRSSTQGPQGVVVDGAGDVFYVNGTIRRLAMSMPPALSPFATTQVGFSSLSQTVGFMNIGTRLLNVAVSNPSHAEDYPSTVSGATACPSVNADGAVLAAGAACVYSLSFIPVVAANPISSSLVVTDNSLNAHNATQTVALTGIGLPPPDTTTVTVVATPASVDQGQNSSVVVTVADSVNPGSVPTGTVTVMDGSFTLAASAALTNGAVSLSYTPAGGGAHTISASYSPTNSTVYQNSAGNGTLQVLPAGTTTTTLAVISGGSQVSSVVSGSAIKLTATVLAASTPVTAGQVNFCDAAAAHCTDIHLLGTAQLTNAGTASIRFTPGVGVYSYKAVFVGTSNLSTTASSASPLTVTGSVGSGPYATATTIATSGNVGAYSLTATVTGTGSFTHAVTGTISFLDASHSNAVLGTQALGASTLGLNFANAQTLSGGSAGVAVGDFNGDGKLDMAVTNSNDATLHIYLGVGGGTFTAGQVISIGNGSSAIAVGDFNGDGKLDLATANYGDNTVTVLLGNGNGTFTATGTSPGTGAGPNGIATGDFNGDGNADLAVANSVDGTVTILHGDGLGGFTAVSTPSVGNWPVSIAVGDFNHDGNLDLAVANLNGNTVTILLGAGNGTFTAAAASPVTGNGPSFIVAGDFNGDGKIDLATANQNDNTVTVLLGNNDGSFAPTVASPASGSNPLALAVADFNHDGKVDLAVTNYNDSTVTVLLGNGDGTFTLAASPSTGLANSDPQGIAIGDFNGDGYPDIVATNANFQNAAVLVMHPELSTETATAAVSNIAILGTGTHNAEASYPGDSNYSSSISSTTGLTAQPSATTITLGASPSSSTYGTTVVLTATLNPFTAGAASSDGEPVTFYNRTTNLGTAILSNGVAALSLSTLPAEAASLTAVYGGDTNLATSSSTALPFTIAPSTAAITFNVASQIYGVAPIAVGATSASSGAFTYAAVSGPATVSGSTVTVSGIGTLVLSATQAASGNYATNSQNTTFTVAAATPTITFNVANQTYGVAPIAVAATSASSGAFTYAVVSGPAAVSGSTVTVSSIGTVILSATQAAGGNYASNTQNASFSVAAATPTITFNVANQTYGVAPNALVATSASSGAFTYAVVSGPATVSGSTLTVSGIGTVVLSATQAAGGNYASNTQNASFTVAVATPTITFNVANQTYGVAPIALAATSASSGSFTYAVVSGPAAISGSTVTVSGIGTVVLSATQVASGNYASNTQNAAFTVAAATPTITFNVASQTYGVAPIALAATSASSGAFTYTVVSGPATVSGSTVTVSGIGTVVLSVTQAASGNYASNTQNASFTVAAVTSMITFNVANQTYGVAPIALAATSASSGVFTYAVVSGPASISGSFVTVSGIGTVVLSAMQAASGNYASNSQNSSFTVVAEMPLLAFSPIPSQTTNSVPFSVNASSASTGAITYAVVSGQATVSGSTVTVSDIGTVVLSATQAASGNYVESYATISFVVDSGFTVTPISSSGSGGVTIPPGGTATYGMALAPGSGTTFPHSVTFAATGVPPGATATFSPLTIPAGSGPTSVTLTIHASDNQASIRKRPLPLGPMAPLALALLLPMMGMKRVRKHLREPRCLILFAFAAVAMVTALGGCGGGYTLVSSTPQSYTIVVTATDVVTGAHTSTSVTISVN